MSVWGLTLIIGLVSWPATYLFFGKLSDRGYSIAKLLGLLTIGYTAFLGATLNLFPLNQFIFIVIVILWSVINLALLFFRIIPNKKPLTFNLAGLIQIVAIEAAFLLIFIFWAYIRGHQPKIYQIERFMDFGFIKTLFNTSSLPLEDIWFSGEVLNYYYFSHFIAYLLLTLSSVAPESGFFVLVAWMMALLAINVYRVGADLLTLLGLKRETVSKTVFGLAGVLSVFSVIFAGTFYSAHWMASAIKSVFFDSPIPYFWYADPTRSIPGTIIEIPIFSFLVSDLHAHVWGLLSGVLILSLLTALWQKETDTPQANPSVLKWRNGRVWLMAVLLGLTYMINSWDVITLGLLSAAVLLGRYWQTPKWRLLLIIILIPAAAYLTALPWSVFFKAPLTGIGIVPEPSPLKTWLLLWSPKVGVVLLFFGFWLFKAWRHRKKENDFKFSFKIPHLAIALTALGLLVLIELFYFRDILLKGEWFRANTVFKVTMQVWLWTGVLSGSMLVAMVVKTERTSFKYGLVLMIALLIVAQGVYPIRAAWQASLVNKTHSGLDSGLQWWQKKYPCDYAAYQYLASVARKLPADDKIRRIVEAEGESYTDASRFSVFLGWPTIIGWPIHEWTWRGSYDQVGARREEVKEIYTGADEIKTLEILEKYNIDYIIVGEFEKKRYGKYIRPAKLKKMGRVVFDNECALVIEVLKN